MSYGSEAMSGIQMAPQGLHGASGLGEQSLMFSDSAGKLLEHMADSFGEKMAKQRLKFSIHLISK